MSMKDVYHELHITPAATQIICTDAAAFNTQFNGATVDTLGYEGNMLVLYFGDLSNATVYTFQLFESDTSAAAAGSAVAGTQVDIRRHDGDTSERVAATGVLTMTGAGSEHNYYTFDYKGSMRWIHLVCGAGAGEDFWPGVMVIQAKGRRGPGHA